MSTPSPTKVPIPRQADARTLAAHAEFDARMERMPAAKPREEASEKDLLGLAPEDPKRPSVLASALAFRFVRLPPRLERRPERVSQRLRRQVSRLLGGGRNGSGSRN